jgi:hypothetical protein
MQNATADAIGLASHDQDDNAYRAVVSDLVRLIEHVQTSLRLIEQAIAGEASVGGQESSANVIVLDDVSPRYMDAAAALQACDTNLGAALHALMDCGNIGSYAESARLPSTARA